MTKIDRLAEVAEAAIEGHADFNTAVDFTALVRAVLLEMRSDPGDDLLDHLGDMLGDKPTDHERAPSCWRTLVDYFLDDDRPFALD